MQINPGRFPEPQVRGKGAYTPPPPLSPEDLAAIKRRAEACQDRQIRTDLFRLLMELEKR